MRRRTYLATAGAFLLSGCGGDGSDDGTNDGFGSTGGGATTAVPGTTARATTAGTTAVDSAADGTLTDDPAEASILDDRWSDADRSTFHLATAEETVFAGGRTTLRALDADGADRWKRSLPAEVGEIHPAGSVVAAVVDGAGVVVHDRASGDHLWELSTLESEIAGYDVATGGDWIARIHGTARTTYELFDAESGERRFSGQYEVWGRSAVGAGDRLYVSTEDRTRALDAESGERLWERPVAAATSDGLAVGNGQVVVATLEGAVGLDAATGEPLWSYEATAGTEPESVGVDGGRAFLASGSGGTLAAVSTDDGTAAWSYEIPGRETLVPRTVAGTVLATPHPDTLALLDVESGAVATELNVGRLFDAVGTEERLFVAQDERVVAYRVRRG